MTMRPLAVFSGRIYQCDFNITLRYSVNLCVSISTATFGINCRSHNFKKVLSHHTAVPEYWNIKLPGMLTIVEVTNTFPSFRLI